MIVELLSKFVRLMGSLDWKLPPQVRTWGCLGLLGLLLTVGLQGCGWEDPLHRPPLRIAYGSWPGYRPMAIAEAKGFFRQQRVNIQAILSDSADQDANFAAGKFDGVMMSLGTLIIVSRSNPDISIILAIDDSRGADALVAQAGIGKVADLKGKRIGMNLGGFGELFVTKILEDNGLTSDDVILINVDGQVVPDHLRTNDIQAAHTWEPYISQAKSYGAKVLSTSEQTPGLIPDGMAFQNSVLRERPEDVRAFVRAWFQAVDYWQHHPQEGDAIVAKKFKIPLKEAPPDGIKLFTLTENLRLFTPAMNTNSLYYTAKLYSDFLIRTGSISTRPKIGELLNPSFLGNK